MTKPPWRVSLIEALSMSCAEIEERRLKYEALSDAEYHRLLEGCAVSVTGTNSPTVADASKRLSEMGHLEFQTEMTRLWGLHERIWRREIEVVRGLLSRVEDAPTEDPVKADVDKVLDHILHRRAEKHHDKLKRTIEQVERVRPGDDAAVGRALR